MSHENITQHSRRLAIDLYRDDQSRADEVPVEQNGRRAYDGWVRASSDAGDSDTAEDLATADRDEFADAWEACVARDAELE